MKNVKKKKNTESVLLIIAIVLAVILVALVIFLVVLENGKGVPGTNATTGVDPGTSQAGKNEAGMPWEVSGAKQPKDYTWEEFLALPGEQQIAFQSAFASTVEFEAWMNQVMPKETGESTEPTEKNPWEQPGAKQPEDYTWAEFMALSGNHQIAFQGAFASTEKFEAWMERVNPKETEETTQPTEPTEPKEKYPWEQPGAKQPADYTWAEFLALSGNQQIAFQSTFESPAKFEAWMEQVNPKETEETTQPTEPTEPKEKYPWEQPGAKQPVDYTWEEFLALSGNQQIVFQSAFGSEAAFEAWLVRVQPTEPEPTEPKPTEPDPTEPKEKYPWEQPGAKQPAEYTWEEFLALSGNQQIVFQSAFGSEAAFEAWLVRVQPTEPEPTEPKPTEPDPTEPKEKYPWEQPGAKQPVDYTWEEFLALSGEEQIAFQAAFSSSDAFEAWMNKVTSSAS